ncbi:hypothetical protein B0H13DRAFT_1956177 [Mycena leptocephala]|nr:hypothetical protein B0H13DRAFT_1956177 [Mycena leptocephala]
MARPGFIVLGLFAFISSSLCDSDVLRPRHNQLKPLKPQDASLIPGLLNRADSCTTCGIGGVCCSNGGCCGVAQRCCSDGGCCELSFSCDTVNGVKGCCPVGANCSASSTTGSKTGSPTSSATTTRSALTSVPTPTAGTQDVVVDMSADPLFFSGQWESTTSSCNSSATSKTVFSDGITLPEFSVVSYSFKGTAIYIKTSSINARYTIVLDSDSQDYGSGTGLSEAPSNCTYGWWRDNLDSGFHYLTISVYGGGANSTPISARATKGFTFELHNFRITEPSSGSSSSLSSSGSSPTTSGRNSGASPSGASTTTAGLSSLAVCIMFGLWTAFLHRM